MSIRTCKLLTFAHYCLSDDKGTFSNWLLVHNRHQAITRVPGKTGNPTSDASLQSQLNLFKMRHLVPLGVLKQLLAGQHGWLILPGGGCGLGGSCLHLLPASSAHGGGSCMNNFPIRLRCSEFKVYLWTRCLLHVIDVTIDSKSLIEMLLLT